jgi:putative nucleotidyltransferase with HDIG domain
MSEPLSRDQAWDLFCSWTESESLRRHVLAVEAAMRAYARRFGEDEERWGMAGLLHDLDWERHPDEHPRVAVEALRAEGYPEEILHAILAHRSDFTGVEPTALLDRALIACDEVTGLITATALVRPTGIDDMKPKSVKKKMKDPAFARGVDRDDVRRGAELLDIDLDEHIGNVIAAMRDIAEELGLTGAQVSAAAGEA